MTRACVFSARVLAALIDEPAIVTAMHEYMEEQGYAFDIADKRLHHEIYLGGARKVSVEKLKTVIRHPIKQID